MKIKNVSDDKIEVFGSTFHPGEEVFFAEGVAQMVLQKYPVQLKLVKEEEIVEASAIVPQKPRKARKKKALASTSRGVKRKKKTARRTA